MPNAMLPAHPPDILRLLAHDLRWQIVTSLVHSDRLVTELANHLAQPLNLVSYHLKRLRRDSVVTTRRSDADGRDIYYSLDLDHLRALYLDAGSAIHPLIASAVTANAAGTTTAPASLKNHRVLFICTHNSARSQMAEGLMRHLSGGVIDVQSAGSHPIPIHPDAITTMSTLGIDISSHQSRAISALEGQSFDAVITVCDRAREVCPTFPGSGIQYHWGFPDPAAIADPAARAAAFRHTAARLQSRIQHFLLALHTKN